MLVVVCKLSSATAQVSKFVPLSSLLNVCFVLSQVIELQIGSGTESHRDK
jgi:hypothetical protein